MSAQAKRIDLNDGWEFRRVGDTVWYPATVPGCVHTDLLNNHLIPDPFYRDNEKQLQWIENEDWEYKKSFYADDSIAALSQDFHICFEGIDPYASVYLNDMLLNTAENAFDRIYFSLSSKLVKGNNVLRVVFPSLINAIDKLNNHPELPGGKQVFVRKPAYMYGWDWAPRFVTSGIWKEVYLEKVDNPRIFGFYYVISSLGISKAIVDLHFEVECSDDLQYSYAVSDNMGHIVQSDSINHGKCSECDYFDPRKIELVIQNPKLWWCNGLGEPYIYMYKLVIKKDGKVADAKEIKIALRTIELVNNKTNGFYFKLNGEPVYMKGANYVPMSSFPSSVTKADHERLINDAVKCNFNMLRVWGGGYYESDDFYDLCDEKGILVWQDFMFACAMYPGTKEFVDNVKGEALYNVNRLRNHPCIALWCGNNEIDEGWHNWGWQQQFKYSASDSAKIWNYYLDLFQGVLPEIVSENSSGVPYVPTSPKIGWGHPEAMQEGDSHYWGVWWGMEPFEMYEKKIPRFMSEFGFQGFPDNRTINEFTKPEDRYFYSDVMKAHQKHPTGYETINTYMEREYKVPQDFDSYIYVSQLLQAYGIKRAIEAERRAKPYCMGSLYWQLNDCWPVVSWSSIDYYGRWKALQYFTKQLYADMLVSPTEDNGKIKVYVVSDRLSPATGNLKVEIFDMSGKQLFKDEEAEIIKANSSASYYSIDKEDIQKLGNLNSLYLKATFVEDNKARDTYSNFYYFVLPKELALKDPEIKIRFTKPHNRTYISLISTQFAKNVHIDFGDADIRIPDDYFDMEPNKEVLIPLENYTNEDTEQIKVISLFDIH